MEGIKRMMGIEETSYAAYRFTKILRTFNEVAEVSVRDEIVLARYARV